ncbi:MAG: nuclear transport factor 2 family protein [Terriglobales bacterium]
MEAEITALEIGMQLVALGREGRFMEIFDRLYADDVTTCEAADWPTFPRETRGIQTVRAKSRWWAENFVDQRLEVEGPFPNGDQFIVLWRVEATHKTTGEKLNVTSAGLYTVAHDKVVREQFFYKT